MDIDDSLTWEGEMPQLERRNRSWWRVLDERSQTGGRAKAWLFLTHPGPSLLVTAVVVAAAGLLTRQLPSERTAVGLVLVALPTQLGIGALNDWADVDSDTAFKPYKPIPRGLVRRRSALALAVAGFAVSIATAVWLGGGVVGAAVLAVAAGASYDLVLKRTPAAVLAWWAGFVAVPLMAMTVTGRLNGVVATIPLAGLISLALLTANGLPDIDGDRRSGANTLPVVLGQPRSRGLVAVALGAAALFVVAARAAADQDRLVLVAAGLLSAAALVPLLPRGAPRLVFPLIALLAAGAAVSWLAALPLPTPA